jgi:hypothetical protein
MVFYGRPCLKLCDASFPHRGFVGRLSDYIAELLADTGKPCSYLYQLLRDYPWIDGGKPMEQDVPRRGQLASWSGESAVQGSYASQGCPTLLCTIE